MEHNDASPQEQQQAADVLSDRNEVNSQPIDAKAKIAQSARYQHAELARYEQDTELKRNMARWVKWLVSLYLGGVILLVAFLLVAATIYQRPINAAVMAALLTTTTVNVLGLSYLVVRHLFPDSIRGGRRH